MDRAPARCDRRVPDARHRRLCRLAARFAGGWPLRRHGARRQSLAVRDLASRDARCAADVLADAVARRLPARAARARIAVRATPVDAGRVGSDSRRRSDEGSRRAAHSVLRARRVFARHARSCAVEAAARWQRACRAACAGRAVVRARLAAQSGIRTFFFIHEHFERFLTTEHRRIGAWWYFLPMAVAGFLPWTGIYLWRLRHGWRDATIEPSGFAWQRFCLVYAGFVLVFFSLSGSKLPSYILPMF